MDCKHLLNCQECADEAQSSTVNEETLALGWYWAYADYTDEGWSGPFETRELAEKHAKETDEFAPEDPTEFSFRHIGDVATMEADLAAYTWWMGQGLTLRGRLRMNNATKWRGWIGDYEEDWAPGCCEFITKYADLEFIAEQYAEHAHSAHKGWEYGDEFEMHLRDPEGRLHHFKICVETVPSFRAKEIK